MSMKKDKYTGLEVAIIGMSLNVPGASNLKKYWSNLKEGKETIKHFTDQELLELGVKTEELIKTNYVKSEGVIFDKEYFDSTFFDYLKNEALSLDPQIRKFTECTYEAIEDSGYVPYEYKNKIGLFAGAASNFNWKLKSQISKDNKIDDMSSAVLSDKEFMATLISYKLNLKGSAEMIDTACSSSLVAINRAYKSLLIGECNMAIAGGITLSTNKNPGYLYQEGMISSKDGHCRAFDKNASGTVPGEGVGVVVLKRLKEAMADGDNIYAIIKGSSVNNDGNRKIGYTAPSIDGQSECILTAQKMARVSPNSISYVEAHGTGTTLGDPIELSALTQAFGKSEEKYCAIGSIKTNIGHLDRAAGVVGLIKTVLCLKFKKLVPSLHFVTPNPEIDFVNSPFYINTELKEWKNDIHPLRAGVSSFGIGGTNAHVVLEEAPELIPASSNKSYQLMCLSAKTSKSLDQMTDNFLEFLREHKGVNLADVAWTLHQGRALFDHRRMFVCSDIDNTVEILTSKNSKDIKTSVADKKQLKIVFMFTGQGSQYINMGKELYEQEEIYRNEVDKCLNIANKYSGLNLKEIMYPKNGDSSEINNTSNTQPLLFIFGYALSKLLMSWGIRPDIMIGHSIGEYTAACLSGLLELEEALQIVIKRGLLMQSLPNGSMLSVGLNESDIKPFLNDDISLAAINGPNSCVVSGKKDSIELFEKELVSKGHNTRKLYTSHAFHSYMMDSIVLEFKEVLKKVSFNKIEIPFVSNLTGKLITEQEASSPDYWCKHLRQTVRFSDGAEMLLKGDKAVFIEIGPGNTLSSLIRQHKFEISKHKSINITRHPRERVSDLNYLTNKIGELWLYGIVPDWDKYYSNEERRRISLPTYPFEKIKYPIGGDIYGMISNIISTESTDTKKDIKHWYYEPSWKRSSLINTNRNENDNFRSLIFTDRHGLGESLLVNLQRSSNQVITAAIGEEFKMINTSSFEINPEREEDYKKLFEKIAEINQLPDRIIHLWNVEDCNSVDLLTKDKVKEAQNLGFYSLLSIAKELGNVAPSHKSKMSIITTNLHEVIGKEVLCPEKATLLGCVTVISQENPNIFCNNIDVVFSECINNGHMIDKLLEEIELNSEDKVIAYRNSIRWVRLYSSIIINERSEMPSSKIKNKGTYLITGGLGGVGSVYAKYILEKYDANVGLVGRSDLSMDTDRAKLKSLEELQRLKGDIRYFNADISNYEKMQKVIKEIENNYGEINGIIHTAGLTQGKSLNTISFLTREDCDDQFMSKVYGLLVLKELFKDKLLDFCLLTSSLSSVLGGLTFSAYSAVNIFMDYFSLSGQMNNCISVNYDGLDFNDESIGKDSINKEEGIKILEYSLSMNDIPQLVTSISDLDARIKKWVYRKPDELYAIDDSTDPEKEEQKIERPELTMDYVEPETEVEFFLCNLWEEFFGVKPIGINDDFFELGGDSLKAMTIIGQIHKKLDIRVPISEVFKYPTISMMADFIGNKPNKNIIDEENEEMEIFEI
ncbi:MAG: SDR family NAD(P)-dependent oxidoreductase [Candidatus Delongbacteria bacterium]|nr:SDR family NAD(P)-dependent oxidoreductase [Candidatus Delongbacteria bacterium]